jgi:hypothetical protein
LHEPNAQAAGTNPGFPKDKGSLRSRRTKPAVCRHKVVSSKLKAIKIICALFWQRAPPKVPGSNNEETLPPKKRNSARSRWPRECECHEPLSETDPPAFAREHDEAGPSMKNVRFKLMLPGSFANSNDKNFFPVRQLQMVRLHGQKWELFGSMIGSDK